MIRLFPIKTRIESDWLVVIEVLLKDCAQNHTLLEDAVLFRSGDEVGLSRGKQGDSGHWAAKQATATSSSLNMRPNSEFEDVFLLPR